MNEERIKISQELLSDDFGLITASGYINNEGGQAIADAANKLMEQGCKILLIDLDGTRIINSIGVSILLEILEKLMDEKGQLAFCNLTPTISKTTSPESERIRRPIGFSPGHSRWTIVSLTSTTSVVPATSLRSIPRPRTIGIPIRRR